VGALDLEGPLTLTPRVERRYCLEVMGAAPPYLVLLDEIHQRLLPRTYLEIGVDRGPSLRLVLPGTRAVGIDPAPLVRCETVLSRVAEGLPANAKVFPLTSDDFFSRYDLRAILDGLPVDLAFIDGMHLFEFVLRDVINVGRYAESGTTVLLHDCYPISGETATREHLTYAWSGDVWKIVLCLKEYCPELDVRVVDVAPTGLGIVRHLNAAASARLQDRYEEICDRFVDLDYSILENDKPGVLNRIDYDWTLIDAILPPPFRSGNRFLLRCERAVRALGPRQVYRAAREGMRSSPIGPPVRAIRQKVTQTRSPSAGGRGGPGPHVHA
jgi:hypothetical protein